MTPGAGDGPAAAAATTTTTTTTTTATTSIEAAASEAASLGLALDAGTLARLALTEGMGDAELAAVEKALRLARELRDQSKTETLLRLSRLPRREPKTFEGFDFSRLQGEGVRELEGLRTLANLFARSNIALIGPSGVGKTHIAQAFGRECCVMGYKTYFLEARELRDRLAKIATSGGPRSMDALVRPSCLIVDKMGACKFDRDCTNLFFEMVDRRYAKETPNAMVLTSTVSASEWRELFDGSDALLCALDRIFDRASVFVIKGTSYRGSLLKRFTVETVPQVSGGPRK